MEINQESISEIVNDTSVNGLYIKFYELLQIELNKYSDKRIESIIDTLIFCYPEKSIEIKKWDRMKILYEYSLLP